MKLAGVLLLLVGLHASAETPTTKPAKSKLNTQIYEQTSEESSFSGIVKVIREIQGESEVFFEGKQGFFGVAPGVSQELLVKSQKKHVPVSVRVNTTSRQILSVQMGE
jgi:hypothetical protein